MKGIPPGMEPVEKKIAIYSSNSKKKEMKKKPIEEKNLHNYSKHKL